MNTLKTIAAALVMIFGAGVLVPEIAVAKPSVEQSNSVKSKASSQSTKVVKKKKKKKKYKKYRGSSHKKVAAVEAPKEPETTCFLFFCNTAERSAPVFGSKPITVASKYDGYTTQNNRRELITFLSEPFDTTVDPARTAWCAAFVNAVLRKSGYDTTDSLMARSFLNYGQVAKKPEEGDIVVLKRGRSKTTGHVGFFLGYDETRQYIKVLGGNQGKMVTTAYYPISRVLGYRKPIPA